MSTWESCKKRIERGLCVSCAQPWIKNGRCELHYAKHKASMVKSARKRRQQFKAKGLCQTCGKRRPTMGTTLCKVCLSKSADAARTSNRALKQEVVNAYGGKCKCCGETTLEFLVVHHSKFDGKNHRQLMAREIGKNVNNVIHLWLRKHRFPKKGFMVLCHNCHNGGHISRDNICPHRNGISIRE